MSDADIPEDVRQEAEDWGASVAEYTAAVSVVEEALRSATHLLTDAETEMLREDLLLFLFGSPEGRASLRAVVERQAPEESGDVPREGASVPAPAGVKRGGLKG